MLYTEIKNCELADFDEDNVISYVIGTTDNTYREKYKNLIKTNIVIKGIPETYIFKKGNQSNNKTVIDCLDTEGNLYIFYNKNYCHLYKLFDYSNNNGLYKENDIIAKSNCINMENLESKHKVLMYKNNNKYYVKPTLIGKTNENEWIYDVDLDYFKIDGVEYNVSEDGYFHSKNRIDEIYDLQIHHAPYLYFNILENDSGDIIINDKEIVNNYVYIGLDDNFTFTVNGTKESPNQILVEFY